MRYAVARPGTGGDTQSWVYIWDKQDITPRTRKISYLISIPRGCAARAAGLIFGRIFLSGYSYPLHLHNFYHAPGGLSELRAEAGRGECSNTTELSTPCLQRIMSSATLRTSRSVRTPYAYRSSTIAT